MIGTQITEPIRARKDKRFKDLCGQEFGWWTVVGYAGSRGRAMWICRCRCGKESTIGGDTLRSGRSVSCGCKPFERAPVITHGMTSSSEYTIWCGIKKRCLNPNCKAYPEYGGRGITVCDRWLESFDNFLQDMGPRPSPQHTIDRQDNNGGYDPNNCRWATQTEQANNRRSNALVAANGKTQSLAAWQAETGIGWSTIKWRIKSGWHPDVAVSTPAWGAKRGVNRGGSSGSTNNDEASREVTAG